MYREYCPHILLEPYIDRYWMSKGIIDGNYSFKVYPDGCVDIIFAFGNSAHSRCMNESIPYVVGTYTTFTEQHFSGEADMFGIRFKPLGITAFIRGQMFEFTNSQVELSQVDSLFDKNFLLSLPDTSDRLVQLHYVERLLLHKLSRCYPMEKRILYAVNLIRNSHGTIGLSELADKTCLCPRQFQRVFKSAVGISPKNFSRIMRFKYTKHYIETHPQNNLITTAFDCGYFDHSHLIKEFSELSGEHPFFFK